MVEINIVKILSRKRTFLMRQKIADEFNNFFTNIGTDLENKIPNKSKSFDSHASNPVIATSNSSNICKSGKYCATVYTSVKVIDIIIKPFSHLLK